MSTTITRLLAIATSTVLFASLSAAVAAAPAFADDVVATSHTDVVASSPKLTATASIPRGIVVKNHGGNSVALFAPGEKDRRAPRPGSSPATFTGLTPGKSYAVAINEKVVTHVTALDKPKAATSLVVRTTDLPDAVRLDWKQTVTPATGGKKVAYDIVATTKDAKPVKATVTGTRSATLSGLNPKALYSFSVTPRNSAGRGTAAKASMTRTLFEITGKDVAAPTAAPVAAAPVPVAAPKPAATPTPEPTQPSGGGSSGGSSSPSKPATKTIWLCPEGFTDTGSSCVKTQPYTYQTKAYTYHQEQVGTTPTYASTCDAVRTVWDGFSWNVEHYSYPCTKGGDPIYGQVKDATPTGWEDTGTEWRKKDAPPAGWSDNGSAYELTAAKVAHEVLA